MKQYQVICQSVRGASHIRRGTPKEDAAAVVRLNDRIIGAVSDGHGDPRCMRSDIGSQLAVDIAMELLREWDPGNVFDDAEAFDARVTALAQGIVDRWNQAVEAHFRENPLTETELKDAGNMRSGFLQGRHISHIYGATLIALLRTEEYLFLLQKGDGHAVVIDRDGNVNDQVVPWDNRCYLNITTSLCDPDASDTFTHRLLQGEEAGNIAAVMLGSDGVEDSFANSDLMGAYYGLLAVECAENGEEATEKAMLRDLSEMSEYGSKDDISVVGLIDPEAVLPLKPLFERMQQRGALALKLQSSVTRLSSMSAAYARREQQLQAKRDELEAIRRSGVETAQSGAVRKEREGARDPARMQELETLQREINQRNAQEAILRKRVNAYAADYEKYDRELSSVKLEYANLLNRFENPNANPLLFILRENALWKLESCKDRLLDMCEAFDEEERQLKQAEQELEDWQRQTQALEQRRKKLADEQKSALHSDAQLRHDAEIKSGQPSAEEERLERELSEIEADFEAYRKKYEAARQERDQLLAQIEQLK